MKIMIIIMLFSYERVIRPQNSTGLDGNCEIGNLTYRSTKIIFILVELEIKFLTANSNKIQDYFIIESIFDYYNTDCNGSRNLPCLQSVRSTFDFTDAERPRRQLSRKKFHL